MQSSRIPLFIFKITTNNSGNNAGGRENNPSTRGHGNVSKNSKRLISLQMVESTRYILENLFKEHKSLGIDFVFLFSSNSQSPNNSEYNNATNDIRKLNNDIALQNEKRNTFLEGWYHRSHVDKSRLNDDTLDLGLNVDPGIYIYTNPITIASKRKLFLLEFDGIDRDDKELFDKAYIFCTMFTSTFVFLHPNETISIDIVYRFAKICQQLQVLQNVISLNNPSLIHILFSDSDKDRGPRYREYLLEHPQLHMPTSIIEKLIPFENQDIQYFPKLIDKYDASLSITKIIDNLIIFIERKSNLVPKIRFSISQVLDQMNEASIMIERNEIESFIGVMNIQWMEYIRFMKKKHFKQYLHNLNHDLKFVEPHVFQNNVNRLRKSEVTEFYEDIKPLLVIHSLNEYIRKSLKSINKKMKHKADTLLSVYQSPPSKAPVLRERKRKRFIDEEPMMITREELRSPLGYRFEDRSYYWSNTFHDHRKYAIYLPSQDRIKCDECDHLIDNFEVYSIGKRLCSISKRNGKRNGFITMEFPVEGEDLCHINCYEIDSNIEDILYDVEVTKFPGFSECPDNIQDYYLRCSGRAVTTETPKFRRIPIADDELGLQNEDLEKIVNPSHSHNDRYNHDIDSLPDSPIITTVYDDSRISNSHHYNINNHRDGNFTTIYEQRENQKGNHELSRKRARYDIGDMDLEPLNEMNQEIVNDLEENTGTILSPHLSPITAMRTPRGINNIGEMWTPDVLSNQILKNHQQRSSNLYRIHQKDNQEPYINNRNNIQASNAIQNENNEENYPLNLHRISNQNTVNKNQLINEEINQPTKEDLVEDSPINENQEYKANVNEKNEQIDHNEFESNENIENLKNKRMKKIFEETEQIKKNRTLKRNDKFLHPLRPKTPQNPINKAKSNLAQANPFQTPIGNSTQEKRKIRLQRFSLLEQSSLDESWEDE